MTLPEPLLQDLADAARLAAITNDPVRMRAAGEWLKVIGMEISLAANAEISATHESQTRFPS